MVLVGGALENAESHEGGGFMNGINDFQKRLLRDL